MTDKKYPQNEYNKRWAEKNKELRRYLSYRSTTKTFINKHSKPEDLEEIKELIKKREQNLKEMKNNNN